MYQLTGSDSIIRIGDGASIPSDVANKDYAEYLEWVAEGGAPLPVGLSDVKQNKITDLNLAYDADCEADVSYNGNVYQADERTRVNLAEVSAFRQAGGTLPVGFTWRALDNSNIAFSFDDIDGLVAAIATNKFAAVANLHVKKDLVISAADEAAVNAITWE